MAAVDIPAYLRRLGIEDPGPPSVAGLRAVHRAHVERVPYENLEIQLGRPTTVDPRESAERVLRGRGGYCYHLNGALSLLLTGLGYEVTWHVGGVQGPDDPPPGASGSHLVLTVAGLPAPECPGGVWLVDAGLGDALHEPLPLRPGEFQQGPFRYRLDRSTVVPGGWRFTHDPTGSFVGMDFAWPPAAPGDFAAMHRHLSTSPDSVFVRTLVVQRRDAAGLDQLRGRVLTRRDHYGQRERVLATRAEWDEALADVFGLVLDEIGEPARADLWRRVQAAHESWSAARAAG